MGLKQMLAKLLRPIGPAVRMVWQQITCGLANLRRRLFRKRLADYAVIVLDHAVSERAPDVPWWYAYIPNLKLPLSLEYISAALHRIARDPDVKGVVFLYKSPGISLAQAQSLAQLFDRFRDWDRACHGDGAYTKEVVVHLEQVNAAAYVAACGADRITMTPLSSWEVLGLRAAPTYLRDTLARIGIEFDVVKIAPWKTAADQVSRSDMSEAEREQTNWLLESLCDDIVSAISNGRQLAVEDVRALIDRAPLNADQTRDAGLVDAIVYEDELPDLLGSEGEPAQLKPYTKVRGLLLRHPQVRAPKSVGVLSLQGAIFSGDSRSFPIPLPIFGERVIGSNTVEQQVRAARKNNSLAAVIVHVDSGGGSSLASDLMWRELSLLAQEKPVIVYMGNVAASGGYYIAMPGRKIVAQSATLTGSIGVIVAKAITARALDKLDAHKEIIQQGDNAGLYAADSVWTDEQRQTMEDAVRHVYGAFKHRVAEGRNLDYDSLDGICNGRVWTGKQAETHNLVDKLGDFQVALDLACEEANLPTDGTVRTTVISSPRTRLMAQPLKSVSELSGLSPVHQLRAVTAAAVRGDWQALIGYERFWLIADGLPEI